MKRIIVMFLFLFSISMYSQNADNKSANWKGWYDNFLKTLKYKIDKKFSSKTNITAVAAVRGASQNKKNSDLYWKSANTDKSKERIEKDKNTIKNAVEKILNGDMETGKKELKEFIEKNPDSYFINEAREALERIPEEKTPEVKTDKQSL